MTSGGIASDRRRSAVAAAVAVALAIALVWFLRPDAEPKAEAAEVPAQTVLAGSKLKPAVCHRPPARPFVPARITVPEVTRNAAVEALPRDANNVPSAIPVSSANAKTAFAWDAPTIKPGEPKGNVLINAHTWPDGTALGNQLLAKFDVGDRMIVHGTRGEELCYTVTKREVIVASDGSWDYYVKDGPPQIALIVCSPPRLGPGNWLHRTIWYASPVDSPQARAAEAS